MTIAATQQRYLIQQKAEYDLMLHPHTATTAKAKAREAVCCEIPAGG